MFFHNITLWSCFSITFWTIVVTKEATIMLNKHPIGEGKEFSLGQYITKLKRLLGW
jgi:hypothetical protein